MDYVFLLQYKIRPGDGWTTDSAFYLETKAVEFRNRVEENSSWLWRVQRVQVL